MSAKLTLEELAIFLKCRETFAKSLQRVKFLKMLLAYKYCSAIF